MALLFQEFLCSALRVTCVALGLLGVAVCMFECSSDPYDSLDPYSGVTPTDVELGVSYEAAENTLPATCY